MIRSVIDKLQIRFDEPIFDDMPPEEKSSAELILRTLKSVESGRYVEKKYSRAETSRCVRKLIVEGYLRGSVFDFNSNSHSKLTRKGKYLISFLEQKENKEGLM